VVTMIVSTDELAAEAGISPQVARELARRKIFVRTSPGKFDREASMANYLSHLRRASTGKRGGGAAFTSDAGDAPNERSRLAAAQADAQELKNQIARSKLVSAAEVESTWATIVTMTRDAVLATPARIQSELPHLSAFDLTVVDKHLREALTRLGSDSAP
jgi:phage terminase Nu1 subunit (DNA packaging protein)